MSYQTQVVLVPEVGVDTVSQTEVDLSPTTVNVLDEVSGQGIGGGKRGRNGDGGETEGAQTSVGTLPDDVGSGLGDVIAIDVPSDPSDLWFKTFFASQNIYGIEQKKYAFSIVQTLPYNGCEYLPPARDMDLASWPLCTK